MSNPMPRFLFCLAVSIIAGPLRSLGIDLITCEILPER